MKFDLEKSELFVKSHPWLIFGIFCLLFVFMYVFFFPRLSGVEDEYGFINNSYLWSEGKIFLTQGEYQQNPMADFAQYGEKYLSKRNPGRSLVSLPFLIFGHKGFFLSSLLIHLALAFSLAWVFSNLGISPLFALLSLFHPTFSLYSRTIMGDSLAGCLVLLGWFYYMRGPKQKGDALKSGLFLGAAALVRYHAGLATLLLAFSLFRAKGNDRNHRFYSLAISGIFGIIILLFNHYMYGPWAGPTSSKGTFGVEYVVQNLAFYIPALLTLWPLMFFLILGERKKFPEALLLTFGFLLFFLFYYFYDKRPSYFETMIVGLRLFQVILPVCIVLYGFALEKLMTKWIRYKHLLWVLLGVVLFVLNCGIHGKHDRYLAGLEEQRQEVLEKIPKNSVVLANSTMQKLFGVYKEFPNYYIWKTLWANHEMVTPIEEAKSWQGQWYIAVSKKSNNYRPEILKKWTSYYQLVELDTKNSDLVIVQSQSKKSQ